MRLNINSGRKGNSTYTFQPLSLVSLDFGRLQPVMSWSTVLGDAFPDVVGKGLLRCTPQVFPPFGRMNLKSASFFIPDSQIFSWSSAFHSDNKIWRGQLADSVPVFKSTEINTYFGPLQQSTPTPVLNGLSTLVVASPATVPARNTYDFTFPSGSADRGAGKTNLDYYKLTPLGWKYFAVFKALGFDFVTFPTDTANGTQAAHIAANDSLISAVPFLAYAKVWNDYFCNSYESDNNQVSSWLQNIYLNKDIVISGFTWYNSANFTLVFDLLPNMLSYMSLPYETNMYTNAWNNVNDPTGTNLSTLNQVNQQSLISPFGSSYYGEFGSLFASSDRNNHSDTHYLASTPITQSFSFSQLGHKTLEAFDKFVRRHNLVGSKAVQQLYAMFGIEPDEWKKDYVVKLSENSSRVNFSAIISQSDTETATGGKPLGAFAGVGLGGYDIQFSYNSGTYGTIVCLAWLNIDPIMMRGMAPDVLRIKPLDFYTPDWDGKAFRPIPYCEVQGGKSIESDALNSIQVYGYTNMYDDYRMMRDVVAGSFLDDTTKNFAFMRDLTETRSKFASAGADMHPQTRTVQYWSIDGDSDLTNPFITSPTLGDRFWFCIDWKINSNRPMLSSENSFDLNGEGNVTVKKNGDGMA